MPKYDNKYRIETTRLKEWDYSTPWWYYITISTQNHINHFGNIKNGKIFLTDLGKVVKDEWLRTKTILTNVELDYFVVMPNHFHGIIILNNNTVVETRRGVSLQGKPQQHNKSQFSKPIKNSLSVIINQFKGSVKRWANKNGSELFSWQPRFYDRIIRNDKELYNIRKYIERNPVKWELEKDRPESICDL